MLDDDEWFCFDIRTTLDSTCSEIRSELPKGQICWKTEVTVGTEWKRRRCGRQLGTLRFGGGGSGG